MRTVKILLGIVAVFAALLVIGGVVWWKRSGAAMMESVQLASEAGGRFGQGATAAQCIDETIRRLAPAGSGFGEVVEQSAFLRGCAEVASGLDQACSEAAARTMTERVRHATDRCRVAGAGGLFCPQVLQTLDALCRARARGGKT